MPAAPHAAAFSAEQAAAIQAQTESLLRSALWCQAPRQQRLLAAHRAGHACGRCASAQRPGAGPRGVRPRAGFRSCDRPHRAGGGRAAAQQAAGPLRGRGRARTRCTSRCPRAATWRASRSARPRSCRGVCPLADGIGRFWSLSAQGLLQAQQSFADAVARDPDYAARACLAGGGGGEPPCLRAGSHRRRDPPGPAARSARAGTGPGDGAGPCGALRRAGLERPERPGHRRRRAGPWHWTPTWPMGMRCWRWRWPKRCGWIRRWPRSGWPCS